ncbi:hypothetical protein H8R18_05400 [Nanchangia anserum]|uniref:Uncharacterized protein n=1 Tax=Nanchangia anserum TaxID=2692125 RepID=A0A8I0KVI6_9ACTO|nr:hypothetical protein [Nanchangia anserum]MBD3688974.1 hypothetical protein [Nanchangia anserum]QOX81229.1 hypothetical protein H8R18_05400 [Nanchangia anserum]
MLKPLQVGDECRVDGFLAHSGWEAHLTDGFEPPEFPAAVPHIVAVGSPTLWEDVVPGLRYTVLGTWDGQVVRARECHEAPTHDLFTVPPANVVEATAPDTSQQDWDLPRLVTCAGSFTRQTDDALISHTTLTRWTPEAEAILDRDDVAVAVLCGHPDDPFPSTYPPYDPYAEATPQRELAVGDAALACGFLVTSGTDTWVTGHWADPPTTGIRLASPWHRFQNLSPTCPRALYGTWARDHLADDGQALIPTYQDYRYRDRTTLVPRYRAGVEDHDPARPLAVLVGYPTDRFVWHRNTPPL